jgi:hypothetical protein
MPGSRPRVVVVVVGNNSKKRRKERRRRRRMKDEGAHKMRLKRSEINRDKERKEAMMIQDQQRKNDRSR